MIEKEDGNVIRKEVGGKDNIGEDKEMEIENVMEKVKREVKDEGINI